MALNTKIRGAQIALAYEVIDVTADSLAFYDATTQEMRKESVNDLAILMAGTGIGASSGQFLVNFNELPTEATFDASADYIGIVDATDSGSDKTLWSVMATAIAGDALVASSGVLAVNVDNSSIETSGDALQVKAGGISNDMLGGSIADGKLASDYIQTSEVDDSSIEFTSATLSVKAGGITNAMLAGSIADAKLTEDYIKTAEVDGVTIEFSSATLSIVDGGVDTTQLAGDAVDATKIEDDAVGGEHINAGAESAGYVLTTDGGGNLSWTAKSSVAEDYLQEAEIKFEDESANANGSTVAFTLGSSPVTNSVQVFLNGLIQQEGSGKDYVLSGTTVTFTTAPASGDILLIHYIAT